MTDQDTDESTVKDEQDSGAEERTDSQETGQDGAEQEAAESDDADVSASGVVVEGYETNNAPREQTKALLEADSPDDVEDDLIKEIEEERDRRLDPENRPDNTEVDNTKRVFVPAEAKFEDSDIDQDPSLGQEGLAPVGGDEDPARSTGSDDSDDSDGSGDSEDSGSDDTPRGEADAAGRTEEEEDPKDNSDAVTSGSSDPTGSDDGSGDNDAGSAEARGGKHKA